MPAREAEAIVLRQYPLSEADCILVLLTREFGLLRAVASGLRKLTSRMAGCLEPLNHVQVQTYAREGADLARIWRCELVHSYLGKNPTLDRIFGFSYFSELAQETVPEHSPNALIFRLLLSVLNAGESAGVGESLVRYFEIWAMKLNGWLPDYDYCSACGRCVKDDGFYAWIQDGEGRCRACADDRGIRIGAEACRRMREILQLSPVQFIPGSQSGAAGRELERLTQNLIEWHLEKKLKSYGALKEMLHSG
jgi:DNA repair protein RecO (recombination protein O)